jgi:hypothetical protein
MLNFSFHFLSIIKDEYSKALFAWNSILGINKVFKSKISGWLGISLMQKALIFVKKKLWA